MVKEEILEIKKSILKEVSDTIASTGNIDSIFSLILDLAINYTKARNGSILLINENNELIVKAARGMDAAIISGIRLIYGNVAVEEKPLLIKDIEGDKRILCFPILVKDKLLGVINISDKIDGSAFTEDELDLIYILANQAAILIENARLMSELRFKIIELDETNKGLIEVERLRTESMARMSHELRTPLNSIKGAIYYLKERGISSKTDHREFIEIISDETDKLVNLLEGLLDPSRFDGERYLLKKRVLDINDVIKNVIETKTVKNLLRDKRLTIFQVLDTQPLEIVGDRTRIFQLFINLIEGSTNYSTPGDLIELRTFALEAGVEVEIFLKARRVPDGELSFIVDSQALWSWPDIPYHHLKFYLVRKTVELHKGSISARNTPEGFSIKLVIPKSLRERREIEITELMNLLIYFTATLMDLNTCSLMLTDELTGELRIRSAYGLDEEIIQRTRLRLGDKIAGWVAVEKKPLLIEDVEKDPRIGKKHDVKYNTRSLLSVPIFVRNGVTGVLNLNNKENAEPFDIKDFYLAIAISRSISHMLEKLYKGDLRQKDFKIITKGMDELLNAEEKYKKKSRKLLDLVFQMMKHLGCDEEEISLALYASLLYDLGLTQIDDQILKKQQRLTALEERLIRTHPVSGAGLINYIGYTDTIKKIILYHHERYDGRGYPEGLKGEEIPLISRVLAVIDTYIAMINDQPYRKAISNESAIEHIKSAAGTQFDPKIVDIFIKTEEQRLNQPQGTQCHSFKLSSISTISSRSE